MTRRRVLLLGSLAVVAALVLAGSVVWPHSTAITQENAAKIAEGMTLAEVEAILGGPERNEADETTRRIQAPVFDSFFLLQPTALTRRQWASNQVFVVVEFDSESRVVLVQTTIFASANLLDRIRRWLGL